MLSPVFIQVSVLLFAFISCVVAQQLTVPITVDGSRFALRFRADLVTPVDAAKQFCVEHATQFGLTDETFPRCLEPISQFVKSYVDTYAARNTIIVPVRISDITFDVQFRTDLVASADMARKLCTENAASIGVTAENLASCVNPVAEYLQGHVDRYIAERTISAPVKINDVEFTVRFRLDLTSPREMSIRLCTENAEVIGVNDSNLKECVDSVENLLNANIERRVKASEIQVPLKIGDLTFNISIRPDVESAKNAATQICTEHREKIGVAPEGVEDCINQVVNYIREWYTAQMRQQQNQQQQVSQTGAATPAN